MTPNAWLLVGTVVTAVAGVLTTWLMIRQQGRQAQTTDAQQIIDQLQEINKAAEEKHERDMAALEQRHVQEMSEVRGELSELRGRVRRMEDDRELTIDYIYALRAHIDRRAEPPPPPWPQSLLKRNT